MRKFSKYLLGCLLFAFIICMLCSCGFELSSKSSIPPQLHVINFEAENQFAPFVIKLRKALKSYGITIADGKNGHEEKTAPITLYVQSVDFSHSDVSTGPSTQARVYNLVYTTVISLSDHKGKTIFGPATITSLRDITMAPNEIFDVSTQVDMTKQSMEQELLAKVFNVLSSRKIVDILSSGQ